jgi:hypothetical protein
MNRIVLFIERLYNTIRYNGFYITLSLLFPYIIYKLDAGKEIIVSMAENAFSLNIALSLLTFSTLCLGIWCIPTLAIYIFQFVTTWSTKRSVKPKDPKDDAVRNCFYKQLVNIYNGKGDPAGCNAGDKVYKSQLPIRYFAIAPWALFTITCLKVYYNNSVMIVGLLVIVAAIFLIDRFKSKIVWLYECWFKKNKTTFSKETFLIRYAVLAFAYLIGILTLLLVLNNNMSNVVLLKWLLILFNLFFLLIFYSFLLYLENSRLEQYVSKDGTRSNNLSFKISNINYWILLIYLVLAIGVFYYCNQQQLIEYISPVVVIVTMSTALIIFFELFFTAQLLLIYISAQTTCQKPDCTLLAHNRRLATFQGIGLKVYKGGLIFLILVIINLYFFSSANSHRIRIINAKKTDYIAATVRPTLTNYFEDWFRDRHINNDDSVVYLISGQGGGSRAAVWFFMNMADLNNRYPDFFRKVFSMSTVSGSTTGANMYLAAQFKNIKLDSDSIIRDASCSLYGRNYMSSSFFGLLLGDFIESRTDMFEEFPRDRNYHLQKEELAAFNETFKQDGKDFFEKDFFSPYLNTSRHWPLFFINSTIVNFGTRGVFSPVQMNGFSIARDLYGEFKNNTCNTGDNIPMVACVNQSQAFPILSAYNYIDCVGRLGDGGISENSGCATTLEIYQRLRQYCDSTKKHVRIICLNITNSNLGSNKKVSYKRASIFNTVNAAVHSPFDGNETYAYKNLERQVNFLHNNDTVINCTLDTSITLSRTLSKESVKRMLDQMNRKRKDFTLP